MDGTAYAKLTEIFDRLEAKHQPLENEESGLNFHVEMTAALEAAGVTEADWAAELDAHAGWGD